LRNHEVEIIPILAKNCNIPPLIQSLLYADFRHSYAIGLEALSGALGIPAPIYPVIGLTQTATCTIFDRGRKFRISHVTVTELSRPGGNEILDLNVYHVKRPTNVRVTSGRPRVESVMGQHRIVTRLARPLPVRRPFKRSVSYEIRGRRFDTEDRSWFLRLQTNFESMTVVLRFSPDCEHPARVKAELDRDGFIGPELSVRRRNSKGWATFVTSLTADMAQWRTLRLRWD
jgi:hypothetical protein